MTAPGRSPPSRSDLLQKAFHLLAQLRGSRPERRGDLEHGFGCGIGFCGGLGDDSQCFHHLLGAGGGAGNILRNFAGRRLLLMYGAAGR
jgi:hypothetical protein